MSFKVLLWMAAVFFDFGSELQLAAALVVNILHLCFQVSLQPLGGESATLLNVLETGTRVVTTYLNAAALCVKYLLASQRIELLQSKSADTPKFLALERQIGALDLVSSFLTVLLLVCFTGSIIRNLAVKVRTVVVNRIRPSYRASSGQFVNVSPPKPEMNIEMQQI